MTEIDLSDYTDPDDPPPGYEAIACPDCSQSHLKPSSAVVASVAGSVCLACAGRHWVWWRIGRPVD
jgi:hypothetical protein